MESSRPYDTFRNFNLIFLKLCIRKEYSTLISRQFKIIDLVFSQIFDKIMQFMSQTSYSPTLVSVFARFVPSEILTLTKLLFYKVFDPIFV